MRQFILAIFIICNIGAGFEVATDFDDAWAETDIFAVADGLQSDLTDGDGNGDPALDSACDHCCHSGAHFAGAVGPGLTVPYVRSSSDAIPTDTPYQFTGRSPPTPPPNV